jgi:hypothetical protein
MTLDPLRREVYGPTRATQLRSLTYGALMAGVVVVVMAGVAFAYEDVDVALYLGLPGLILIGFSVASLVHLRQRGITAKVLCAMTATLVVVVGILVFGVFGVLLIGVGVWMLVQSLRRDDELV